MPQSRVSVTHSTRPPSDLPDCFSETVIGWRQLESLGIPRETADRLVLDRTDGCCGAELFGMLYTMWTSGAVGQRPLQRAVRGHTRELAGLLGQREWVSQSSMSRALRSVDLDCGRAFCDWLLSEALPVAAVEQSEAAFHCDTRGERWRVVDIDGRVRAFRRRKLPAADVALSPKRRTDGLATPGYVGRKRGETQYHQMVVQDAGAGRTLSLMLAPGNGDHRGEMTHAFAAAARWADLLGLPRQRMVTRFDGKAPSIELLAQATGAGIQFVTRWADYKLLEDSAFRAGLQRPWARVSSSGSGPERSAVEFASRLLVPPGDDSSSDDAPTAEPVTARLIATRYTASALKGCGRRQGDQVYELFITSLPADNWPPEEVVALYYGRSVVENRFWQHDRDTGAQQVVSFSPAGQLLSSAVAHFVETQRLHLGAVLAPQVVESVSPPLRTQTTVAPPELPEVAPVGPGEPVVDLLDDGTKNAAELRTARRTLRQMILPALFYLDWDTHLKRLKKPGITWNADKEALLCPAGHTFLLRRTYKRGPGVALDFRLRDKTACATCPIRTGCTRNPAPGYVRDVSFAVPPDQLQDAVDIARKDRRPPPRCTVSTQFTPVSSREIRPGPHQPLAPYVVPSAHRTKARETVRDCRIRIHLPSGAAEPPSTPSPKSKRQHARRSRHQRLRHRLLPARPPLRVHVEFQGHLEDTARAHLIRVLATDSG